MNFLLNIFRKRVQIGLLFIFFTLLILFVTKIKFFSFLIIFILAISLAFYIENSNNQSKIMKFIKKYL